VFKDIFWRRGEISRT
jgi:hypothetical protein